MQKKCLRIITFSFYKDHSNSLFKDLKLLKLCDVLESEIIKFFYKFSRNELSKSVSSIFNLVQTYENELKTSDTRSNNFLLIFSPERSFMKCSPATQWSNLMIEIDKVIYMDIDVYIFYMCLYVYICLYRYVLFALVYACSYLHIFTYLLRSYRGLIRLHFVFWSPLSLHC